MPGLYDLLYSGQAGNQSEMPEDELRRRLMAMARPGDGPTIQQQDLGYMPRAVRGFMGDIQQQTPNADRAMAFNAASAQLQPQANRQRAIADAEARRAAEAIAGNKIRAKYQAQQQFGNNAARQMAHPGLPGTDPMDAVRARAEAALGGNMPPAQRGDAWGPGGRRYPTGPSAPMPGAAPAGRQPMDESALAAKLAELTQGQNSKYTTADGGGVVRRNTFDGGRPSAGGYSEDQLRDMMTRNATSQIGAGMRREEQARATAQKWIASGKPQLERRGYSLLDTLDAKVNKANELTGGQKFGMSAAEVVSAGRKMVAQGASPKFVEQWMAGQFDMAKDAAKYAADASTLGENRKFTGEQNDLNRKNEIAVTQLKNEGEEKARAAGNKTQPMDEDSYVAFMVSEGTMTAQQARRDWRESHPPAGQKDAVITDKNGGLPRVYRDTPPAERKQALKMFIDGYSGKNFVVDAQNAGFTLSELEEAKAKLMPGIGQKITREFDPIEGHPAAVIGSGLMSSGITPAVEMLRGLYKRNDPVSVAAEKRRKRELQLFGDDL